MNLNKYKKNIWNKSENLVAQRYENSWYKIIARNYTIPWWEIDIVVENLSELIFIEVKTIDHIDDIDWYVSKRKIALLKNCIEHYLMRNPSDKEIRIDVVFVKNNLISEIYENITNN